MSLEAWKEKYYPQEASATSKEEALDHSIRKWEGLYPSILKEYGLVKCDDSIYEIEQPSINIHIDSDTCALCYHFQGDPHDCTECPLAISRNGVRCDRLMNGECISPYAKFLNKNDPTNMLHALKLAKTLQESQNGNATE